MTNKNNDQDRTFFEVIKETYFKYEEFDFLKIKAIRFPIIISLLFFSIFWNGAESPDFENASRNITIGQYYCPPIAGRSFGYAKVNDDRFYHDWSKVFGFLSQNSTCRRSHHNQILKIEWISHNNKRLIISIIDPETDEPIPGYQSRLQYLNDKASSNVGVYFFKLIAFLIATILIAKTNLSNSDNNK